MSEQGMAAGPAWHPLGASATQAAPQAAIATAPLWRDVLKALALGARAAVFRRVNAQSLPGASQTAVILALLALVADILLSWLQLGEVSLPNVWGITAYAASLAMIAAGLLVVRGRAAFETGGAVAVLIAASIWVEAVSTAVALSWPVIQPALSLSLETTVWVHMAGALSLLAWLVLTAAVLGARVMSPRWFRGSTGFALASLASLFILPVFPIVNGTGQGNAGLLQWAVVWLTPAPAAGEHTGFKPVDVEDAYARQPRLLQAALSALEPSRPRQAELYFVAMGAFAEQDVFLKEATAVRSIVDERLGTRGRSVLLVNNRETVETIPLANATNLSAVMDHLSTVMDKEKDVLVVFMTSHGNKNLFSVSFGGLRLNDLTPEKLAAILDRSGVRHRVVIVSACYSGSFIKALEGENTLVITAASAERASFGCSNERDWTYFGDAYFNHALRETRSFTGAFERARDMVAAWEIRDKLSPASEPQISAGAAIRAKLEAVTAALDGQTATQAASESVQR